jgi:hypothetical protein
MQDRIQTGLYVAREVSSPYAPNSANDMVRARTVTAVSIEITATTWAA